MSSRQTKSHEPCIAKLTFIDALRIDDVVYKKGKCDGQQISMLPTQMRILSKIFHALCVETFVSTPNPEYRSYSHCCESKSKISLHDASGGKEIDRRTL